MEQLLKRVYGRSSEKFDPNQLRMFEHKDLIEAIIPEHLERVEIILDLLEEKKVCPETGKPPKQIGWEVTEKLEHRPGKLFVNVYKRPN